MENNPIPKEEQDTLEKWSAYREAAREEYEYAHSNANRLDNKVYILLAVCAFLFPILHSARIETADFMSSWPGLLLACVKFSPLICLSVAIILLLSVLKTVEISRIDIFKAIQEGQKRNESQLYAEKRFTFLYMASRRAGAAEWNRKYIVADIASLFIIASVFLSMIAVIQQG
ncbi:MAG: hypothetical protein IJQ70_01385 [Synergistaceae bacterium]|nr:hypothetical protein [Synergistaceae bacterium]